MEETILNDCSWSRTGKFCFRFAFIYILLYCLPFPFYFIPGLEFITEVWTGLYQSIAVWGGTFFFGTDITVFTNGSGDTTYDYVLVFCLLIISAGGAVIWTFLDRGRSNYQKLYYYIEIYLRFYLAITLFGYGLAKVVKTQFPFPLLSRLQQPYGDSSPMGLAWTFMGYSTGYNYFTGFAEVLAGALLLFKRTTLLGALSAMAVMANVVAMNFCYDVPVKLFSFHLFAFAFLLALRDLKSLFDFFVKNKNAVVKTSPPVFKSLRVKQVVFFLKLSFIVWIIFSNVSENYNTLTEKFEPSVKPPLYGIYLVQNFALNSDTLAPLTTDSIRWKTLTLDIVDRATVRFMNDTVRNYSYNTDTLNKTVEFTSFRDSSFRISMNYEMEDKNLVLNGLRKTDSIKVSAIRKDEKEYLLVRRGYNWINEFPFNR